MIGGNDDYPAIERAAAARFGRAAREAGVERVIYLGGLGDESASRHLAARHDAALALRDEGPPDLLSRRDGDRAGERIL